MEVRKRAMEGKVKSWENKRNRKGKYGEMGWSEMGWSEKKKREWERVGRNKVVGKDHN